MPSLKTIGLISDNHSYYHEELIPHLQDCDEIWHAGDIGSLESLQPILELNAEFKAVYGNIDTQDVRDLYPLNLVFHCEEVKVFMTHIGGYPGKYKSRVKNILLREQPDLYICGHSHICKVIPDKELGLIHMNPGAYGHHGFHAIRTLLKFNVDGKKVNNLRAIELGLRGRPNYEKIVKRKKEDS